jgi:hypothetical protein
VRIPFDNLGKIGLVGDVLPHELAPEAWTNGKNVRMLDGIAQKMLGHVATYGTPGVAPYWLLPVPTTAEYRWLYASLTKVYTVDSAGTHTDITRTSGGDYAATLDTSWTGGLLNGIPVINNGVDVPQMWNSPVPATKLVALSNWNANWIAKSLRPYRSYLFAMDVTETGTRYPHKVRWSHPALPGAVPASWDETDTTKDAGQVTLSDTGGFVLDSLPLRNTNVVYKEDQIWGFQFVGGNKIFEPVRILSEVGAMSRECAVPFFSRGVLMHAVFGADDLLVHDGNSARSIANKKVKRWLFNQIDPGNFERCFVVANYAMNEVWFCFPSTSESLANWALPWSWVDDSFGLPRELPSVRHIASGLNSYTDVSDVWDSDSATWDSDSTLWDERAYGAAARRLIMGVPSGPTLQYVDQTNQFAGSNMTVQLERTGLAFSKQARDGTLKADLKVRKLVRELWPRIEGTGGGVVNIYVGAQEEVNSAITWAGPFPFTIGTSQKINPWISGRFIAVRFESNSDISWKLHGYELELEPLGVY